MRVSLLAAVDLFFAGLCSSSLSRSVLSLSRAFSLCMGVCLSFLLFCLPFCVRLSVSLNYKICELGSFLIICVWEGPDDGNGKNHP